MRKAAHTSRAAARPPPRTAALALPLLALLALLAPRAAGAHALLATPVELVAAGGTARVLVQTSDERAVTVEWGAAPYATHVARSPAGRNHAVSLRGLRPGGVYVYSVRVGGVLVSSPRPFVMPGAPAAIPAAPHTTSL